ncbi:MAG: sigma-54-dependent Fis family transcriptional regulator, partial [Candidatus Zixiibacteriota bacterium]
MASRILIVDDEPNILTSFASLLRDEGHLPITVSSAEEASKECARRTVDLILLDLQLPGKSGLDFLRESRNDLTTPKTLVISGQAEIADALEAVRLGAIDFLEKPVPPEKLIASVSAALTLVSAEKQRTMLVNEIDESSRMVGESPVMGKLLHTISQVAPSDAAVLITGENGTGKELVATRLYLQSKRRNKPFVRVNCPGIPETLFESELFGYTKGAFTGAVKDYPGRFVIADSGTLLLDEIGDLPLSCQAKLLRVLETGEVETLGRSESRQVDVRVFCATNHDLGQLIAEGKFREDHLYRISVFAIEVPSLSARVDD